MPHVSEKNNFLYLTLGIVILLFVSAASKQFYPDRELGVVQALLVINMVIGLYGFKSKKLWFHSTIGISLSIIFVIALSAFLQYFELHNVQLVFSLCFYLWAMFLATKQVMFSGTIDINEIIGAVCIYLLMGLIWALIYLIVAQFIPQSFNGISQLSWHENFFDLAYFSFVTLTTLGYGDITPAAPLARFLVYMEAIVGVFYMAILVASLIGARVSEPHHSKDD